MAENKVEGAGQEVAMMPAKGAQPDTEATFSAPELAKAMGFDPQTLLNWRNKGEGPAWSRRNGGRLIAYKVGDVAAWLGEQPLVKLAFELLGAPATRHPATAGQGSHSPPLPHTAPPALESVLAGIGIAAQDILQLMALTDPIQQRVRLASRLADKLQKVELTVPSGVQPLQMQQLELYSRAFLTLVERCLSAAQTAHELVCEVTDMVCRRDETQKELTEKFPLGSQALSLTPEAMRHLAENPQHGPGSGHAGHRNRR